jgi:hypothetical protein
MIFIRLPSGSATNRSGASIELEGEELVAGGARTSMLFRVGAPQANNATLKIVNTAMRRLMRVSLSRLD